MSKRTYPEYQLCKAFIERVEFLRRVKHSVKPFMIAHIANEFTGKDKQQRMMRGIRNQQIGVRAGMFDYVVFALDGSFFGFLEAKRKKGEYGAKTTGELNDAQKEFKALMDTCGIPAKVFYSVNEGEQWLRVWGLVGRK